MWQLIGANSKEIYGESQHKSDLNKWFLKTYTKDTGHKDGVHVDMPEPMYYVENNKQGDVSDVRNQEYSN